MADHDVETHTVVFDATVASKEALSRGAREILKGQIEDEDTRADSAAGKQERRRGATFAEIAGEWRSRHGKPNKSRRAVRE